MYENQLGETKVLNDIIIITNISRNLINENILKINQIIGTILSKIETIDNIPVQLRPLFTARRFLFMHSESLMHHTRIRSLMEKCKMTSL